MPFQDSEIQLGDVGIIGIEGQWADNPQKSNRAGKSAFLEALLYALYGETRATKDKELRNSLSPDEPFWVEVDLSFPDGTEATIKRGREVNDSPILIFDDGEPISGFGANEEIENLIGFNYDEFVATHFFKQGDIDQFMKAKNKQKRELLLGWLPFLSVYKDAKELALDELREVKAELKTAETFLEEDHDEDAYDEGVKELSEIKSQVKGYQSEIQDMEKQETKINKQISSLAKVEELNKKVNEYEEGVEEIKERKEKETKLLAEIKKEQKKFLSSHNIENLKTVLESHKIGLEGGLELITELKVKAADLRGQKQELKKNKGVCPILKEGCDRIKGDSKEIDSLLKRIEDRLEKTSKQRVELEKQYEDQKDAIANLNDRQRSGEENLIRCMNKLKGIEDEENRWSVKLNNAKYELKEAGKFDKKKADKVQEELETVQDHLANFREMLSESKQKQGELEAQLENLLKQQRSRLKWEARAEGLERRKRTLNFLTYAFGENGIMGKQVESVFADIQDDTNFILSSLGLGLSVTIPPFRLLESYDEECPACGTYLGKSKKGRCPSCDIERPKKRKDELTLTITDEAQGGRTEAWEMDSGAGKTLITLAVRLAVSRMIQRMRSRSCGMLVLDEVFAMLDPVNRDGLLGLLNAIKSQLGFEQIFVVSHTEIKDFIPDVLVVKRNEDNVAELEWRV